MNILPEDLTKNQVKDTGMAMALALLIVGLIWDNMFLVQLAVPVLLIDMIWPAFFKPVAFIWFAFANIAGTIVSRILLTIVFFLIVTPVGFIRRMLGYDSLQLRKFQQGKGSVMKDRNHLFSSEDIEKPY